MTQMRRHDGHSSTRVSMKHGRGRGCYEGGVDASQLEVAHTVHSVASSEESFDLVAKVGTERTVEEEVDHVIQVHECVAHGQNEFASRMLVETRVDVFEYKNGRG